MASLFSFPSATFDFSGVDSGWLTQLRNRSILYVPNVRCVVSFGGLAQQQAQLIIFGTLARSATKPKVPLASQNGPKCVCHQHCK